MNKNLLFSLMFSFLCLATVAQPPQSFNYQSVIRDATGNVIAETTVALKISILSGSASGPRVYSEVHNGIQTNAFGLISLKIGEGTPVNGTFSAINWSSNSFFIKIELDPENGTNWTNMGTSQLSSVPYALHANTVENDQVDDADADPNNEIQQLHLSGTQLSLSKGGGTVTLPSSGGGDNWGTQAVESNATLSGDGTSDNPLGVVGDLTDDQTLSISGNNLSISGGNTIALPGGSTPLWQQNADFPSRIYYNSGNVGIGTSNPQWIFEVESAEAYMHVSSTSNNSGIILNRPDATKRTSMLFRTDGNNYWRFGLLNSNNDFDFNRTGGLIDDGTFHINHSNGFVGIGTTSPDARLDVSGSTKLGGSGVVFSEIREFSGTTGTGHSKPVDYPSGYNMDNTRVLSLEVLFNGTHWCSMGQWASAATSEYTVSVALGNFEMYIYYPDVPEMHNKKFRMILMKVEE